MDGGLELKYALRSLKNIKNFYGNVYVIGDREKWFSNKVIHIPVRRQHSKPYLDQILKMRTACMLSEMGEHFIAMMDDVYITEPLDVGVWYLSNELKAISNSYHQRTKQYTADMLGDRLLVRDYEVHSPMLVTTRLLTETLDLILQQPKPHNIQWRSVYGNMWDIKALKMEDAKTKTQQLKEGAIISTNSYTPELDKLFPNPSPYEII